MARIQGLTEVYLTGDTLLKSEGAVEVFSVVLTAEGATAGQKIVFRNGTTGGAQPLMDLVVEVANGSWQFEFPNGKRFESGCYVDFQGAAGKIHLALTYK